MKRILFLTILCLIGLPYSVSAETTKPVEYSAVNHPQNTEKMAADPFKAELQKPSTYVPESANASATADSFLEKEQEDALKDPDK